MSTYGVGLMGRRRRRRHSAEVQGGGDHSLNANMLRKWVIDAEHKGVAPMAAAAKPVPDPPPVPPTFVPLALPAPVADSEIRIELHRAGTTIKLVWPASAARGCAAWLSDWLR